MKLPTLILALAAAAVLSADPLERDATVYAQPDPASSVLGTLPKGTSPELAASDAPDGWLAVLVPGPHEVYVRNGDLGKDLNIKTGSSLYIAPDTSAPVIGTMESGDRAELKGLRGDWTLFSFNDPVKGFIKLAAPIALTPAAPAQASGAQPPRPAGSDITPSGMPRFLEGRFKPTRSFLGFHQPYNFQLVDKNGDRIAYLDISRLLQTDKIDNYDDRLVIVYGTAHKLEDAHRKGIVIEVESLHLK